MLDDFEVYVYSAGSEPATHKNTYVTYADEWIIIWFMSFDRSIGRNLSGKT